MKRLALVIVCVAAFVTVAGLYASGPSHKLIRCYPARSGDLYAPASPGGCIYKRTNAWERFKGAITGNP